MSLFRISALDRSLIRGARANAAQAVQQNARMAELRRQATTAQVEAVHRADAERPRLR